MRLSAVLLARVIAFVEMNDLNPRGKIRLPVVAEMIVSRFGFAKYPQTAAEFDETKGVEFLEGSFDDIGVDKLTIWFNGVGLDVRSSTDDAKSILEKSFEWLKKEVGLNYAPDMVKRWAYLNQITFYSDADFNAVHPALRNVSNKVTAAVSRIQGSDFAFSPNYLGWGFDRTIRQFPISDFSIQRRADTPFSENKYFSQAPLSTDEHLKILAEFEADLLRK
ncbi:MAG TPA: hypothetical protein VFA90_12860 [Terriglobales bacterium]|nr:hypothetical protein [Terriglobales bacterium]